MVGMEGVSASGRIGVLDDLTLDVEMFAFL
jgi:hypothetical protein